MIYTSPKPLNLDDEFVLVNQVLPSAKAWVMNYQPSSNMHQLGLNTLQYWSARDDELEGHLGRLAAAEKVRTDEIEERREYFRELQRSGHDTDA